MRELEATATEVGTLARLLREVDLFSELTIRQLERVLDHVRLMEFSAGEAVFHQGDPGDAFYVVRGGKISIRIKRGFLGLTKPVAEMGPGAFFGETAIVADLPRNASAVCEEPTQLFVIMARDFKSMLAGNPAAAEEMKCIAERRRFETAHH